MSAAPATRPVHPCVVSLSDGTRGVEHATWAYLTRPRPRPRRHGGPPPPQDEPSAAAAASSSTSTSARRPRKKLLPNLVTASASTVTVYSVDESNGRLRVENLFPHLNGSVVFLAPLPAPQGFRDGLVLGFAGQPQLSVVQLAHDPSPMLRADCLIDLTSALTEASLGSVTPLEQDLVAACSSSSSSCAARMGNPSSSSSSSSRSGTSTVACVLGGGVAVAAFQLTYHRRAKGWVATEPFVLPLSFLASQLPHVAAKASSANQLNFASVATGMGDIVSCAFVSGYLEPVVVLLHTEPGGRTFAGRLGRPDETSKDGTATATTPASGAVPMHATAISVGVAHRRAAVLWSCPVTADAQCVVAGTGTGGSSSTQCLVVGVNTILVLRDGRVQHAIAANGWARATCPTSLQPLLAPNPMVRLALSLDGCSVAWVSPHSALVSLRSGQLYVLQRTVHHQWSLLPLGQALGGVGEVETLVALPFSADDDDEGAGSGSLWGSVAGDDGGPKKVGQEISVGLVFAGSRLGNSILMGYALESVKMRLGGKDDDKDDGQGKGVGSAPIKPDAATSSSGTGRGADDKYEQILRMEEEALYAPVAPTSATGHDGPNVIPASDDDNDDFDDDPAGGDGSTMGMPSVKRQRLVRFTMVKALTPLDALVNLGPLGPSCVGPVSTPPPFLLEADEGAGTPAPGSDSDVVVGSSAFVFPCGFGSSGGVALATVPGRDDRMILAEVDCLDVDAVFSLPLAGVVLLGMSSRAGGGTRALGLRKSSAPSEFGLEERPLADWCTPAASDLLKASLRMAGEDADGSVLLLSLAIGRGYVCSLLREVNGMFDVVGASVLRSNESNETLIQVTPPIRHSQDSSARLSFMCLWSDGEVQYCSITTNAELTSTFINALPEELEDKDRMEVEEDEDDEGIRDFYRDPKFVSVDLFKAPKRLFMRMSSSNETNVENVTMPESSVFDDDEEELYGTPSSAEVPASASDSARSLQPDEEENEEVLFAAVCRQSGALEVFEVGSSSLEKRWASLGCGHGAMALASSVSPSVRLPRFHKVSVNEIRFFFSGPSPASKFSNPGDRTLCLALQLSNGDSELYGLLANPGDALTFVKVPIKNVGRPSQEQGRHRVKLARKGIAQRKPDEPTAEFLWNQLHRFVGVSGQDGLFSASSRPFWVIAERGRPTTLFHRTRYAAPAGVKERPVPGFCSGLPIPGTADTGFLVLHERVGRAGTQRLTAFGGLSKVFASTGSVGGLVGLCFEKIPLGVTVHRIEFINESATSNDHPLYAMLVSREVDVDQSSLNSDGLSQEERERKQAEKEAARIRKQVEADLGGFDMESEWVEEIERENCFPVDTTLGGAPPLREKAYSLWIVDAANEWAVVDSFELDRNEHGLTMTFMNLTDFKGDAGIASSDDMDADMTTEPFFAVGTGIVDHNGEDVASRGRVLLFQVKRRTDSELGSSVAVADLALVYEKEILHGPVTTLSCLSAEGKHRLVIGAGADINIEQWGSSKLTQVGFFRATMQILDILMFKNFMILSDAYDSLYFLVWRESDKSLTLLAKDYDPIPVYAAGLISRGAAMAFLCHDDRQNLQLMQYAPGEAAARGGNKLVCRADFHLGTQTSAFSSHFCRSSMIVHSATPTSTLAALKQQDPNIGRSDEDQKLAAFFGSADGGLGAVVPLSEPVYWRLLALQAVMANALDSDCALSPRAWRLYRRTPRRGGCRSSERKKGVIDGNLVFQYAFLPKADQEDLASSIGSTVDLILDNLLETQCGSMML